MSINSISSQNVGYASLQGDQFNRIQQQFTALGSAIKSGNLKGAQSTLSSLQQLLPGSTGTTGSAAVSTGAATQSPLQAAMSQLQQALSSGNTAAAQTAYTQLQQAMQSRATNPHHGANGSRVGFGSGQRGVIGSTGSTPPVNGSLSNGVLGSTGSTPITAGLSSGILGSTGSTPPTSTLDFEA